MCDLVSLLLYGFVFDRLRSEDSTLLLFSASLSELVIVGVIMGLEATLTELGTELFINSPAKNSNENKPGFVFGRIC